MINDKSQDSTAKHLSCDELLPLKCIIQFAGKRIFKIGEHLAKLQAKMLHGVIHPICIIHRESKKKRHQTLGHNFTNYYPIFKIFSLADSVVNLQQTRV